MFGGFGAQTVFGAHGFSPRWLRNKSLGPHGRLGYCTDVSPEPQGRAECRSELQQKQLFCDETKS